MITGSGREGGGIVVRITRQRYPGVASQLPKIPDAALLHPSDVCFAQDVMGALARRTQGMGQVIE